MKHKNRGGLNTPEAHARATLHLGECEPCGKLIYLSRAAARQVGKRMQAADPRPRPYRCLQNPQQWHLGHIPDAVRQGEITGDQWSRRRGWA